jgi:hypothetical protein
MELMIGQPFLDRLHVAEGSTHPDTAETHVSRTEIRHSLSYRVPTFKGQPGKPQLPSHKSATSMWQLVLSFLG